MMKKTSTTVSISAAVAAITLMHFIYFSNCLSVFCFLGFCLEKILIYNILHAINKCLTLVNVFGI